MVDMKKDIGELNTYYSLILNKVENIDEENLDESLIDINKLVQEIEDKKSYLKRNYSLKSLKENCDAANMAVKQIKLKFDDIIEAKKEKESFLVSELNKKSNEKKLIKYKR